MNLYDPNGSIREYRRERNRREIVRVCIFGGLVTLLLVGMAAWIVLFRHIAGTPR
jgi:hypothetical protein